MLALPELLMAVKDVRIRMTLRKRIVLVNLGLLAAMLIEYLRGAPLIEEFWSGICAFSFVNLILFFGAQRTKRSQ
jgi:uncharacterized membrane protein YhhN